jgi:4-diphosphocytidyl-2-C-methyl-D-erythritol kinase
MTSPWTAWPAPAKLNLFLHITGRRTDGYHLLQTVFQLLDWGDTVHLRLRDDGIIERSADLRGVDPDNDLCIRAARLLRATTGCQTGVDIRVDKRIPMGGGLGGGSSDAATVLVALNALWQTRLSPDQLAALGIQLGADVPVFVHGHSAWAEGIGEQLTPVDLLERSFVILDPQISVPTAPLFQAPELTRNTPPATIGGYVPRLQAGTSATTNAFAPVVRARYPQIAAAMDWLDQFGAARLSGSGGCVFAALDAPGQADAIIKACPAPFRAWLVGGVNRSPLLDALERYRIAGSE